jgi:hypothetical protein
VGRPGRVGVPRRSSQVPPEAAELDVALVMRNVPVTWHGLLPLRIEARPDRRHERRWEGAQAIRLTAQPLPGSGGAREIDEDVRHWPEHWLLSNRLTAQALWRGALRRLSTT